MNKQINNFNFSDIYLGSDRTNLTITILFTLFLILLAIIL